MSRDTILITNFSFDEVRVLAYRIHSNLDKVGLIINSCGGSVDMLGAMLELIEYGKNKGKIIITGTITQAQSCGAILLSAGTKGHRFSSKNANIMVHEAGLNPCNTDNGQPRIRSATFNSQNKYLSESNKRFLHYLDVYCDKKKGFFRRMIYMKGGTDVFLRPEEALKLGIIDRVGIDGEICEIVGSL